jgi:hypothetical protein
MTGIVGRGSGNVWLPGSNIPFKPLNPYGQAMPKLSRPYRAGRHALYQVEVELRSGKTRRIGPKWAEEMAGSLCETINRSIAIGVRNEWGRAYVVLAKPAEERDTRTIGELLREVR